MISYFKSEVGGDPHLLIWKFLVSFCCLFVFFNLVTIYFFETVSSKTAQFGFTVVTVLGHSPEPLAPGALTSHCKACLLLCKQDSEAGAVGGGALSG